MNTLPGVGLEADRLREAMIAHGFDAVLLSEPASVCYVTGFAVPLMIGAGGAFAGGPILAGLGRSGSGLLVSASEAGSVGSEVGVDAVIAYNSFGHFTPVSAGEEFLSGLDQLLRSLLPSHAPAQLGIEPRTLPAIVTHYLADRFPSVTLRDASTAVATARMVKTPHEIALLRRAARAADSGQAALLANARAGASELSLWNALCGAIEEAAGAATALTGELVSGPRTSVVRYPGGPTNRVVAQGDTIICDISPCIGGYYADCCNTLAVGEATAEQRRYFRAARDAWEAAVEMLRPGKRALDAAEAAHAAFTRHGLPTAHYTGHGIGAAVNERPRLVPYDETPIEAGMVFAVEPGAYAGEGGTTGARTEKMVLVTPAGPEVLTRFAWGIAGA